MNIKKSIKACTIGLLGLLTLSSTGYNPMNHQIHAKHIRYSYHLTRYEKYHLRNKWHIHMSKSQYTYDNLVNLVYIERQHPSYFRKMLLNNTFSRYKQCLSTTKLIDLQHYFHIYHLLYAKNKNYYRIFFNQIRNEHTLTRVSKQDSRFDTQLRDYMIRDINQTRRRYHKRPLTVTIQMQKTANYRSPKVLFAYEHPLYCRKYEHVSLAHLRKTNGTTDKWVHGIDTHTSGLQYLAKHHYYPDCYWGANASDWFKIHYPYTTPRNIAREINNAFMYHDMIQENHNSHRKNELNSSFRYLGVGVNYNPKTHMGSLNEQFTS